MCLLGYNLLVNKCFLFFVFDEERKKNNSKWQSAKKCLWLKRNKDKNFDLNSNDDKSSLSTATVVICWTNKRWLLLNESSTIRNYKNTIFQTIKGLTKKNKAIKETIDLFFLSNYKVVYICTLRKKTCKIMLNIPICFMLIGFYSRRAEITIVVLALRLSSHKCYQLISDVEINVMSKIFKISTCIAWQ